VGSPVERNLLGGGRRHIVRRGTTTGSLGIPDTGNPSAFIDPPSSEAAQPDRCPKGALVPYRPIVLALATKVTEKNHLAVVTFISGNFDIRQGANCDLEVTFLDSVDV
jgi:hypothetical protein